MSLLKIKHFSAVLSFLLICGTHAAERVKSKAASDDLDKSGSDIIASHNTRFSSPTASSYYGYQTFPNSPLSSNSIRQSYMYNPLLADPYERVGREYASASSNIGYAASAPDLMTAAGGHGGGSGGGGGGGHGWHGWHGHGHGHTKVDNKGLGLLGLLGLLSLLQGVLNALARTTTTTTMAPAAAAMTYDDASYYEYKSKQKRSIKDTTDLSETESMSDTITRLVLPSLNIVAHARDGNLPLHCTHHEVCRANKIFIKELGRNGHILGYRLSGAIGKLLHEVDKTGKVVQSVDSARVAAQNGLNCHATFPVCTELLKPNGEIAYPPPMLSTAARNWGSKGHGNTA